VLSNQSCGKRLTAPGAVVEDTEKTAVFLYSKVKHCALTAPSLGAPLGLMLHYYGIFP
jgi:hypothetical protein